MPKTEIIRLKQEQIINNDRLDELTGKLAASRNNKIVAYAFFGLAMFIVSISNDDAARIATLILVILSLLIWMLEAYNSYVWEKELRKARQRKVLIGTSLLEAETGN